VDLGDAMLELAGADAAEPVPLAERSTFTASASFRPSILDVDGMELDSVQLVGGVIEGDDGTRNVAVLATPDEGEWLIGRNTTLRMHLPESAGVRAGAP